MKHIHSAFALMLLCIVCAGCYKTELNYPGGVVSPYIAIYDVRNVYKGKPVTLGKQTLFGSNMVSGIVVSDHSAGNLPEGLLVVQNSPRLAFLRGLSFQLGKDAAAYKPGDSVHINLEGTLLSRENGILTVSNITADKVLKKSSGNKLNVAPVNIDKILARPNDYESTLIALVKAGFINQSNGQTMSGDHPITDGYGVLTISTNSNSSLANTPQHKMANYYGIVFTKQVADGITPYIKPRLASDIVPLNSVYKIPRIIISGWNNDPAGSDANYEYIQLLATQDINFATTPFSIVTTNNANASAPTGFPVNGWATGQVRTYKINITSGFAAKGTFFYVGGTYKLINSTGSTSMATSNWVATRDYTTLAGNDFGTATTNLLANSGNAYGVAVFEGTTVTAASIPEDVMFCSTGGSLYGNNQGYRICNNDYYDVINPLTLAEQAFYRAGTNTNAITYSTPADAGLFNVLGGQFNMTLGRWTKARTKLIYTLKKDAKVEEIENPAIATKLVN